MPPMRMPYQGPPLGGFGGPPQYYGQTPPFSGTQMIPFQPQRNTFGMLPQGNRGGLLSKLLGGARPKYGMPGQLQSNMFNGFGAQASPFGQLIGGAPPAQTGGLLSNLMGGGSVGSGGGMLSTLNNVQNVLNMAQTAMPMIQQYGPMVKNLPAMLQMMKALSAAGNSEENSVDDNHESSILESFDSERSYLESPLEDEFKDNDTELEKSFAEPEPVNPKASTPKLYV